MASIAFVFGIDAYASPTPRLTSAVIDARRVASWLVRKRLVAPADLHLGVAPLPGDEQQPPELAGCVVFKPNLEEVITRIDAAVKGGPYERVYFFFAGHGVASQNERTPQEDALCLPGYTAQFVHNALTVGSIATALKGMDAPERYLIIDACRNRAIAPNRAPNSLESYPPKGRGTSLFVLNASPPGERAISIVNGGGLMTTAFIQSVDKGEGSAKRWDETSRRYIVPWSRLTTAVGEQVKAILDQTAFTTDDRATTADPVFVAFAEDECPEVKLTLSFKPSTVRTRAKVSLRRDGAFEDDLSEERELDARPCEFSLKQSEYLVKVSPARIPGDFVSVPRVLAVKVFDAPAATGEFTLDLLAPPSLEMGARADEVAAPAPAPVFQSRSVDGAEAIAPLPAPERGGDGELGTLAITVGGAQVRQDDPWLSVSLATAGGEPLSWDRATPNEDLRPGAYTVSVSAPDGTTSAAQAIVESDKPTTIDLPVPVRSGVELNKALAIARSHMGPDLMPSERLGPISGVTFSALGALSVVQAITGYDGRARSLGLGDAWAGELVGRSGVHLLIADERDAGLPMQPERLRVWRMYEDTFGRAGETRQPDLALRYGEVAIAADPNGSWAELRDRDRQRRAGFKLATHVASDTVTLLTVSRETSGATGLFQFLLERPRGPDELLRAVFYGEALQRARIAARPLAEDAALQTLLDDQWFEPLSAAVAAFALYDAGNEFDDQFRVLAKRLNERAPKLPDTTVAGALLQELDGQGPVARMSYQIALNQLNVPVCRLAMIYLKDAAIRHRLHGRGLRYLMEKSNQSITHPLWTLRREDDIKPARVPRFEA